MRLQFSTDRVARVAGVLCVLAAGAALAQSPVLINELDADTDGSDRAEFVELYDGGAGNTALTGLVVVFYNGSDDQSYAAFDLDGAVTGPDGYYVLGNPGVANVNRTFSPGGSGALQNGADAVALYRADASDFPGDTPLTTQNLVDGVVYGTGDSDDPELLALLASGEPQLDEDSNGQKDLQSLQRSPDGAGGARSTSAFVAAAPTPGAAIGSGGDPGAGDGIPDGAIAGLRIYDIQGAAHISPFADANVAGVPGVVTAVDSNGIYIQDPVGDGDPLTADALFVFTGGSPETFAGAPVAVDDVVLVSGRVEEFQPGGPDDANLTITEISTGGEGSIKAVANPGAVFPTTTISPVVIGQGGRLPPTLIIDNDTTGSVNIPAQTVFDPAEDGIDFFETLEGMLVAINNAQAVSPTNRFGEIFVVGDSGAFATGINSRGGITLVLRNGVVDYNPERIQIDGDLLQQDTPAVDVGALFTRITGVVSYSFGNFEVLPSVLAAPQPSSLMREDIGPLAGGDTLSIAGYNVENLDPNDTDGDSDVADGKFARIAAQIVNNLGAPDIVALQEVQDNNGSAMTNNVVAADQTLAILVAAIEQAGGPSYAFAEISPLPGTNGGQPGGNIRLAYLYDPARMSLVEAPQGAGDAQTATQVIADAQGRLLLSHNPGLVDPQNPAFNDSRKPLAGLFAFRGQRILVVNNHFSSKGGGTPLYGERQPFINGSADQRLAQAEVLNAFVDGALAVAPEANIALVGDFNEFAFLPPLKVLTGANQGQPVVTDLLGRLDATARYTYVFQGNSQALDHVYVSDALLAGAWVDVIHANAEFADQVSDHDPIVAQFDLSAAQETPEDPGMEDPGQGDPDEGDPGQEMDDDDSSGGCTMGNGRDASLPILLLVAMLAFARRRSRRTGC